MQEEYDVVILGAGVAGATLAHCLAGADPSLRVLLVEKKTHPRFTIGESTVPATTWGFTHLARTYAAPALDSLSNYTTARAHGIRTYPKCHFWFGLHRPHTALSQDAELVFETFRPPLGPDSHLRRDDLDAYLTGSLASACPSVDYLDDTVASLPLVTDQQVAAVLDMDPAADPGPLTVDLSTYPPSARGVAYSDSAPITRSVRARFVVDATGHSSVLGSLLGLTQHAPDSLKTHTRVLYGHYAYDPEARSLDALLGGPNPQFRYHRESGTLHHCFEGGWLWVIPFEDETLSLGLLLDPRVHPLDPDVSPAAELAALLARFPTMQAHLGGLTPTRPLYRSPGRIQLAASRIAGSRFLLMPHAATFVDPLFSTGMLLTVRGIARSLPVLLHALATDVFRATDWAAVEDTFATETAFIDTMVAGALAATVDIRVFTQFWRVWIDGTIRHTNDAMNDDAWFRPLYGSGEAEWVAAVNDAYAIVAELPPSHAPGAQDAYAVAAASLKPLMDSVAAPGTWRLPFYPAFDVQVPDAPSAVSLSVPAWIWTDVEPKVFYPTWASPLYFAKGVLVYSLFCIAYYLAALLRLEFAESVGNVYAQHATTAHHTSAMVPMRSTPVALRPNPPSAVFTYVAPPRPAQL